MALLSVKRNSEGTLTIRWRYTDKTNQAKAAGPRRFGWA